MQFVLLIEQLSMHILQGGQPFSLKWATSLVSPTLIKIYTPNLPILGPQDGIKYAMNILGIIIITPFYRVCGGY